MVQTKLKSVSQLSLTPQDGVCGSCKTLFHYFSRQRTSTQFIKNIAMELLTQTMPWQRHTETRTHLQTHRFNFPVMRTVTEMESRTLISVPRTRHLIQAESIAHLADATFQNKNPILWETGRLPTTPVGPDPQLGMKKNRMMESKCAGLFSYSGAQPLI